MESGEHAWIGDQVNLQFESGTVPSSGAPLFAGGRGPSSPGANLHFTYGQGIALGGDFFGVVGTSISRAPDRTVAFRSAYATLTNATDSGPILSIMEKEIEAIGAAFRSGQDVSPVYDSFGDTLSYEWNKATGGGSFASDIVPMGRYLRLAAENWDHFTSDAVQAYRAGHAWAAAEAAQIRKIPGLEPKYRQARLENAYLMNAFADHFLTDLFSAGHLRAPRKELYDQVTTPVPGYSGTLGSLLTRCMHDEDSEHGLNVHNANGDSWTAYGDKRLLDHRSADNRAMVVKASQVSAAEIWAAYTSGDPKPGYRALSFVPDLVRVQDTSTRENFSPLFVLEGGTVARRNSLTDRTDFSWSVWWVGAATFAELKLLGMLSAVTDIGSIVF